MLPYFRESIRKKVQIVPIEFSGLNRRDIVADAEIVDGLNLSSDELPAMSSRRGRQAVDYPLGDVTSFATASGKYFHTADGKFYCDGVEKGTVSAGLKRLVDFNQYIVIFPDNKYYDYVGDTFGTFTPKKADETTISFVDVVSYANRLWGVFGSEIRASKWGDFKTWDDFSGENNDSYATDVYSPGNFKAVATYQNHLCLFKENVMYEVYGSLPSNYELVDVAKVGCADARSLAEVNGVLFFASRDNIYAYAGGLPQAIGDNLNLKYVASAVAGASNDKYYVSIIDGLESTRKLYVFDTKKGVWLPEDSLPVVQFYSFENALYAACPDLNLILMDTLTPSEQVQWSFTTKDYDESMIGYKYTSKVKFRFILEYLSKVNVYLRVDGGEWTLVAAIDQSSTHGTKRTWERSVGVEEYDRFQIKVEGAGPCTIFGQREFIVGGENYAKR